MTAQQLKNSILQMAVQGKLVPQDPNDEPASALLERIRVEKQALIKAGKIKKEKPQAPISEDETPFEIPDSWEWCRLGICLDVRDGTHDTPKYVPQGIPLVTSKNLCNGHIDFTTAKFISVQDHEAISQRSKVDDGDIMFAMIGSIGNPVLYYGNEEFSIKNMALFKRLENGLDMSYVYWYLFFVQTEMKKVASGGVQSFVSLSYLRNYFIPVPPLNEQHRIVSKIEELLPYIERYGKAEEHLTVLNTKFPEALKKSILQEAVHGKLVPQNPDDEPASVLLERIKAEKQKLIKEGKIKKEKPLAPITEEEIPFDIPESWEWCRLKNIVSLLGDGIHGTPEYSETGKYFFINGNNLSEGNIIIKDDTKKVDESQYLKYRKELNANTVFVSINGTIGNIAFYNNEPVILGKSACYFNLIIKEFKAYMYWLLKTDYFLKYAITNATGSTIKNVSLKTMNDFLVPLPPLEEQKRIVAKIEELMPFIGNLTK